MEKCPLDPKVAAANPEKETTDEYHERAWQYCVVYKVAMFLNIHIFTAPSPPQIKLWRQTIWKLLVFLLTSLSVSGKILVLLEKPMTLINSCTCLSINLEITFILFLFLNLIMTKSIMSFSILLWLETNKAPFLLQKYVIKEKAIINCLFYLTTCHIRKHSVRFYLDILDIF